MGKELTNELLVTEIFSLCMTEPRTIEDMTNKIYKNLYAKNLVRCYQTCQILMKRGIIVPTFRDRTISFKVDDRITERKNNG